MKQHILVSVGYSKFIHVTPEIWLSLIQCDLYNRSGYSRDATYQLITDINDSLETVTVLEQQISSSPEVIAVNDILSENNRLARQVSDLEAQLARATATKSSSNEVALI